MINKNELIGNTNFTIEFIIDKLKSKEDENCSIENLKSFKYQDITGGAAFFSEIYSVKFNWKFDIKPNSVVLKIPKLAGLEHIKHNNNDPEFLNNIKKKFEHHLERSYKIESCVYNYYFNTKCNVKLPTFYYSHPYNNISNEGIMIIEDLTEKGKTLKLIPGFTNTQVENLINEIAKFHSISIRNKTWLNDLNELPPKNFLSEMKDIISKLKNIDNKRFDKLVDRIIKFITPDVMDNSYFLDEKYGFKPILVHSDLWSSNILWKIDKDNNPTNEIEAIIDWQMAAPGNPGIDISRVLAMNTCTQYRRENTDRLLKLYLKHLEEHLQETPPMNFEQLKNAYNHALGFCAIFIGYGTTSYYNMKSVVDEPPSNEIREELLNRCESIFIDMLNVYENF